jgi:serine/threonine protein phosphatase PrpC
MEDKSKSIENFNNDINQMVFELFDGHGGDDISNFLQQNFVQIYKQYLEINNYNIPKSLTYSFKEADEMIKESLTNLDGMGSTGTIIHIFWESDTKLMVYTGNVGDSRVTLISPTHIIKLSYDHRMSDEKEKKRILESGIEVIENRIGGELMLTRIFGDYEFKPKEKGKEKEKGKDKKKGLICEPFLSKIKIDLNIKDQFLILASDGIWDLVTEKEIQQMLEMTTNSEKLCAMIIKKALDKDAWDNMSVFAIKLT